MIAAQKNNIDLASVVMDAGVELTQLGTRHCGLCPFHDDRDPSFYVFQDNHFKCFGCGASGDCIDFVQKMYGLSFPDALQHLGIEQGRITPEIRQDIQKRKRQAELVKEFRKWCFEYCLRVSDLWHKTKKLMMNGIPPDDLELYALLFHMLPVWEYHREILIHGTDEEKYLLYKDKETHGKFQFRNAT